MGMYSGVDANPGGVSAMGRSPVQHTGNFRGGARPSPNPTGVIRGRGSYMGRGRGRGGYGGGSDGPFFFPLTQVRFVDHAQRSQPHRFDQRLRSRLVCPLDLAIKSHITKTEMASLPQSMV